MSAIPVSSDADSPRGTVARASRILKLIAESGEPVRITDLASDLGLAVSTVHRLLQLLRAEGLVSFHPDTQRYDAGPGLHRLASLLAARYGLADFAQPILDKLAAATGETAQLGVYLPSLRKMSIEAVTPSIHPLRFVLPVRTPQSLLWGCSGRSILAFLPDETVRAIYDEEGDSPAKNAAKPPFEVVLARLERIKEHGWDRSNGEKLAESVGFAAPVFDASGVVGCIAMPVPVSRFDERHALSYIRAVVDAAGTLSKAVGR
ncbi:IclR family transcriptional regulator [Microbacterium sp. No. 7]|uniref:IclR family transcriptional regulator n=1 Tax=Microbacterium sp. No. 7 TaxID=1714373 RepID=UPI0006D11FC7|nr:IclR family transcriptional regulator [Microbacterium sp. No. 7]ALJ22101.1 hypothetical protein AOA12_20320 [Microbacterium sp. No. 7]